MIPRREKSKDEFSLKSPPACSKVKSLSSIAVKREKSTDEIPKSIIPKREKSKEDFSTTSSLRSNKPKILPKKEKSKEEISAKPISKREKSKEEISANVVPKREKSKEEFSKNILKKEKSTDEIKLKSGKNHFESKTDQTVKSASKRIVSSTKSFQKLEQKSDDQAKISPMRSAVKNDSTKQIIDKNITSSQKSNLSKKKSREDVSKIVSDKREDKDVPLKQTAKSEGFSKDINTSTSSFKKDSPSPKALKKSSTKDSSIKTETEPITITKREKCEEMTTLEYEKHTPKQVGECRATSETFTCEKNNAAKLIDNMSALMDIDFTPPTNLVTSVIDHKATASIEQLVVKSSEIDAGLEKIIADTEKKDLQMKESSSSREMKKSPVANIEEQMSAVNENSTNASRRSLVNLTEDLEILETSSIQTDTENEHSIRTRSIDREKTLLTEEASSVSNENIMNEFVKLEKALQDNNINKENSGKIPEVSTLTQECADNSKAFDEKQSLKYKVHSISSNSENNFGFKNQSPKSGTIESEIFHDKFADDLTWEFEDVIQKSNDNQQIVDKMNSLLHTELSDQVRSDIDVNEDKTKDELATFDSPSTHVILPVDGSAAMSSSSASIQTQNISSPHTSIVSNVTNILSSMENIKLDSDAIIEGKYISELSGARVLEILEPENESMIKQDLLDESSITSEEALFLLDGQEMSKTDDVVLHESLSVDSLNSKNQSLTLNSLKNTECYSSEEKQRKENPNSEEMSTKRRTQRDSFEIESPPLVSPRSKIKELEIRPVDWMIGDEKIKVSENLQPYQAFDKELEEYESMLKVKSQEAEAETKEVKTFNIPRIEKTFFEPFEDSENVKSSGKSKFTVIPVSEQDIEIEKELVENELDISCQELMDTLQKEHDARTPRYSLTDEMYAKSFHFGTLEYDEDLLKNDRFENLHITDVPLETKAAVNVIENEEFMSVDEYLEPIASTSKPNNTDLMQLYEENFEETLPINEKSVELIQDRKEKEIIESIATSEESIPSTKLVTQSINLDKELNQGIEDKTNESLENSRLNENETINLLEKTAQLLELSKITERDNVPEIDNTENTQNWSYDLQNYQHQPVPSELVLKTDINNAKSEDNVELLSYKTFDPEEAKKEIESQGGPGVKKPPKTDFHRDGKFDLRSKGWDDHKRMGDKREKLHMPHQDISPYKIKKEDFQNVDVSTRYGIKVLDQVVKKEIAEVKENLEAAKQDLIEELSENSDNVIQIKDSPSEFQFKLQPESIPNELPFLYKAPSLDKVTDADNFPSSSSPIAKPRKYGEGTRDKDESSSESSSARKKNSDKDPKINSIVIESESDQSSYKEAKDIFESFSSSPKAASRAESDPEGTNKDENFSLQPPQPVPRRRQKPSHNRRQHITSESEADISSSGESNYQSCEYEIRSRPCSSDVEALQSAASAASAAHPSSTTASEYESEMMTFDYSSAKLTSQDYYTAVDSMSSRESVKSLNSISSGQMGSIDSELSETLIASEPEMEADEIDENLENILDDDMKMLNYISEEEVEKPVDRDLEIPCMMKRSSEMIFSQVVNYL
jgi:hypothetical protein